MTSSETWWCFMCHKLHGVESRGERERRQFLKRHKEKVSNAGKRPGTEFPVTHSYEMGEHCKYQSHYYGVAAAVRLELGLDLGDWEVVPHVGVFSRFCCDSARTLMAVVQYQRALTSRRRSDGSQIQQWPHQTKAPQGLLHDLHNLPNMMIPIQVGCLALELPAQHS